MRGSAVLVHGGWGHPEDWRWVVERLPGLEVHLPDLPSHRSASAGLAADAAVVVEAISAATPPVVVVGWSRGGDVIGDAAAGRPQVTRLVYVASLPRMAGVAGVDAVDDDPHVRVGDDGTFVLDDEWWLTEGDGATLPDDVQRHLWQYRRRPINLSSESEPQRWAAWQDIPTTVVLGRTDDFFSEADWEWARAHVGDVRILDTDHFILWRHPDVVADVILEALAAAQDD